MRRLRRSHERGHVLHGWLDTYHTFSFAHYVELSWMGFGPLRVINEDRIEGGQGFGEHFHADMEIITYVISGSLRHQDSMGNGSDIKAGRIQYMSAGRGVMHSEVNPGDEPVHLLQIWIEPNVERVPPRYAEKDLTVPQAGRLQVLASADGRDGSIEIRQDAELLRGMLRAGDEVTFTPKYAAKTWIQVIDGALEVDGDTLRKGDGLAVTDEPTLRIKATSDAHILVFDLPN